VICIEREKMDSAFLEAIKAVTEQYKAAIKDGKLSFGEVLTLLYNAVATFVQLAEKLLPELKGPDKKAKVVKAVGDFYDQVLAPIDIAAIPNFLEPMVDSAIRSLIMTIAAAAVDSTVNVFNAVDWGPQELTMPGSSVKPIGL
jgi:hypothetical protein